MSIITKTKNNLRNHLINIPGWRTNRKIVVFESDDWGAVRTSSKEALQELSEQGILVGNCHYVSNDALASEQDLTLLFEILRSHENVDGVHPMITANVIMGNPDFDKIDASGFSEYYYELFTETLNKYPQHHHSFSLWKQGIQEKLFHPQFHGREHLQVQRWMHFLQQSDSDTRIAFMNRIIGLSTSVTKEKRSSYLATYDWDTQKSRDFVLQSIADGLDLFEQTFGFKSLSAIAPNYTWHEDIESVMAGHGVRYIQGSTVQKIPTFNSDNRSKTRHFTGQKNELGQRYLVRNCNFEPSSNPDLDWVSKCIKQIETSFFWKKPAIVEMHRVNFIGYINNTNRDKNLKALDRLLEQIIIRWPNVQFMTSDDLGKYMESDD